MNTATHTASSLYGNVHQVTISDKGIVKTASGVLLGDVEGMERLGWEFEVIA
jgi:hypothetical protein